MKEEGPWEWNWILSLEGIWNEAFGKRAVLLSLGKTQLRKVGGENPQPDTNYFDR